MDFKNIQGNVSIKISDKRFIKNIAMAQKKLDAQILADCTPYVPFQQGYLRNSGHIVEDGLIEWSTPYAHYQYEGIQYIDPKLGVSGVYSDEYGWWSHKGVTKIPTTKPLEYKEQGTGSHWFENAKQEHLKEWESLVKRELAKG